MNNEENMNNNTEQSNVQETEVVTETTTSQTPEVSTPQPTEAPKKNNSVVIIILVLVVLGGVGFFAYNKLSKGDNEPTGNSETSNSEKTSTSSTNCIEDAIIEGTMTVDDILALEVGDTQYILDSKFNIDLISDFYAFEDIKIKLCYSDKKPSANFQVGSTTKSKTVESIELYDRSSNKKLNSTNTNDLLKELGYHPYGTYQEEATLVDISTSPRFGISGEDSYLVYDAEIEFESGKKVKAEYKVTDSQNDKSTQLEKGKKYSINFNVEKDSFDPFVYIITDFK